MYPNVVDDFEIVAIQAREIIDSRGNPTVEVDVATLGGGLGRAAVPAGASRGENEALELRDGEKRFRGKGVLKAVGNVNNVIAKEIVGMDSRFQREIDAKMIEIDGTPNKSRLGANAILGVSLAVAKAAADTYGMPLFQYLGGPNAHVLPAPLMNIINGGKHAGNLLSIQEFMIIPIGATSFREALQMACEIYYSLKDFLKEKYGPTALNVGDEGGFAPPMKETREALDALIKAIKSAGYDEKDVVIGLDAAASSFYDKNESKYLIDGQKLETAQLHEYYMKLIDEYPIKSIEDPFYEEDFEAFKEFTASVGKRVQVVGDDLFVTNINRLKKGIDLGAANALLLKVNQVGTLTEALDAAVYAFRHGYKVIVSHRSGETGDTTIADLAVALNTGQIKTGAPARGERTAKYNQLLRIEEFLGESAKYAGKLGYP
ncbi:MAG: phosphopyruvate hydratase [Thermoprotei archaeon]|nr:MAG: phosphopyruvate hydratase [Thermoprotei archaeon]RLF01611.1 MAG: phosphopyruvate hydratase [Thermoprotei archaeon]